VVNLQINIERATHMKKELRYKYFSRPRYNRYLAATANNNDRAKRL
jgi:hypothetical protein